MEIVINHCHGGFGLSDAALERYNALTGKSVIYHWDLNRADPALIQVIKEMGTESAGGTYSELKIVDIPDGVEWEIEEYDGMEWVAEKHRTWS